MTDPDTRRPACPVCCGPTQLTVTTQDNLDLAYLLDDETFTALGDVTCALLCPGCGHVQPGILRDAVIDLSSGLVRHGAFLHQ